jgi:hypothetical protein
MRSFGGRAGAIEGKERPPARSSFPFVLAVAVAVVASAAAHARAATFRPLTFGAFTPAAFNDWPTYQYDVRRDGYNPNTTALSVANVSKLHLAWVSPSYDFNTWTQPILIGAVGAHKAILVYGGGTGHLYAVDALTGRLVWRRLLGNARVSCHGDATFGVGGTSVYDPAERALYAATTINTSENSPTHIELFKIDPATGGELGAVTVTPSNLSGELNFTHTGLTLSPSGLLYLGTGSTCDVDSWRGSIVAVDAATLEIKHRFYSVYEQTGQTDAGPYSGGGIWGWGGPSLDGAGDLYTGVGNSDINQKPAGSPFVAAPTEHAGYGDHFVKLSPDLTTVLGSNLPANETFEHASQDLDFSGTPVISFPLGCAPRAAAMGKAGGLYIYDTLAVGSGPLAHFAVGASAYYATSFSTPAYSPLTGLYYAPVASSLAPSLDPPGMIALTACAPRVVWHVAFGPDGEQGAAAGYPRSAPTVTAGGLILSGSSCAPDVWGACAGSGSNVGGAVWLQDATTGAVLGGGRPLVRTPNDVRMAPVADGDWVYFVDNGGYLYGFTIDPSYKAIEPPPVGSIRRDPRSLVRWR